MVIVDSLCEMSPIKKVNQSGLMQIEEYEVSDSESPHAANKANASTSDHKYHESTDRFKQSHNIRTLKMP